MSRLDAGLRAHGSTRKTWKGDTADRAGRSWRPALQRWTAPDHQVAHRNACGRSRSSGTSAMPVLGRVAGRRSRRRSIVPIAAPLGVGEQRRVLGAQEAHVDAPQGGRRAPDLVEAAHQRQQGPVQAALLDLVLLGVEVLLAAGRDRRAPPGSRSPSRCRSWARGSPPAPAAPRRRPARRSAGTRGGCPACWRRSSAGSTPTPARPARTTYSASSCAEFFQVK